MDSACTQIASCTGAYECFIKLQPLTLRFLLAAPYQEEAAGKRYGVQTDGKVQYGLIAGRVYGDRSAVAVADIDG